MPWQLFAASGDGDVVNGESDSPLLEGSYISVLGSYLKTIGNQTFSTQGDDIQRTNVMKHGYGGAIMFGYRKGFWALEIGPSYSYNEGPSELGGEIHGLVYPFSALPNLYGTIGFSILRVAAYPGLDAASVSDPNLGLTGTTVDTATQEASYTVAAYDMGFGDLIPLSIGRYDYALRGEVRYRYGERKEHLDEARVDFAAPRRYNDLIIRVGLELPLSLAPMPTPPPVEEKPAPQPLDSDGDGVADDRDQCPGTPPGVKVDERGCALPPPPPPCRTPAPGERISLAGCGTGDIIVLRGVNFEFNKAQLTVNAKTLLSNVAEELNKYPSITVEIGGYTDSKGSDSYNQKLSQRRADSVKKYFLEQGIAAERMTDVGYGESNPVADNATGQGRELNRRVELKITGGSKVSGNTSVTAVPTASPAPAEAATSPASSASAPADHSVGKASPASAASIAGTPATAEPAAPAATAAPSSDGSSNLNDLLGNP